MKNRLFFLLHINFSNQWSCNFALFYGQSLLDLSFVKVKLELDDTESDAHDNKIEFIEEVNVRFCYLKHQGMDVKVLGTNYHS